MSLLSFEGAEPRVHSTAFVAPGAMVIGDVEIGEGSSIWYNCVLRGDVNRIHIGARTNIQDGTVIHVDSGGHAALIGDECLIGHLAMVHGCRLHDRSFVGLGSIVMDGCEIEAEGMLAAGAMLTPGKRIGRGELWVGRPAKLSRLLTDAERARNAAGVAGYVELARRHRAALATREAAPAAG